jgi:hypothetical protein
MSLPTYIKLEYILQEDLASLHIINGVVKTIVAAKDFSLIETLPGSINSKISGSTLLETISISAQSFGIEDLNLDDKKLILRLTDAIGNQYIYGNKKLGYFLQEDYSSGKDGSELNGKLIKFEGPLKMCAASFDNPVEVTIPVVDPIMQIQIEDTGISANWSHCETFNNAIYFIQGTLLKKFDGATLTTKYTEADFIPYVIMKAIGNRLYVFYQRDAAWFNWGYIDITITDNYGPKGTIGVTLNSVPKSIFSIEDGYVYLTYTEPGGTKKLKVYDENFTPDVWNYTEGPDILNSDYPYYNRCDVHIWDNVNSKISYLSLDPDPYYSKSLIHTNIAAIATGEKLLAENDDYVFSFASSGDKHIRAYSRIDYSEVYDIDAGLIATAISRVAVNNNYLVFRDSNGVDCNVVVINLSNGQWKKLAANINDYAKNIGNIGDDFYYCDGTIKKIAITN